MLDLPGVVEARPVGYLDLVERVLEQPVLVALALPGAGVLMLVEDPEAHGTDWPRGQITSYAGLRPLAAAPRVPIQQTMPPRAMRLACRGRRVRATAVDRGLHAVPHRRDAACRAARGEREALMRVAAAAAAASEARGRDRAGRRRRARGDRRRLARDEPSGTRESGRHARPDQRRRAGPARGALPRRTRSTRSSDFPAVARLLQTGMPYFTAVDDPDADAASPSRCCGKLGKESDIGVPVIVDGEVWGEVWATTRPGRAALPCPRRAFPGGASPASCAGVIARAELFSDVSRLAYEDPLTGLANRRALEERLDSATASTGASRERACRAACVCDVDELKAINDARGHHAGDRALKRVAEALVAAASAHPSAMPARLSGDEFAVVLEGLGVEGRARWPSRRCGCCAEDATSPCRDLLRRRSRRGRASEHPGQLLRAADTAPVRRQAPRGRPGLHRRGQRPAPRSPSRARRRKRRGPRRAPGRHERRTARRCSTATCATAPRSTASRWWSRGFAEALNAAAWTISFAEHGSPDHPLDRDSRRPRRAPARHPGRARGRGLRAGGVPRDGGARARRRRVVPDRPPRSRGRPRRARAAGRARVLRRAGHRRFRTSTASSCVELYARRRHGRPGRGRAARAATSRAAASGRSAALPSGWASFSKRTRQLALTGVLGTRLAGLIDEEEIVEAAVDELRSEFGCPRLRHRAASPTPTRSSPRRRARRGRASA